MNPLVALASAVVALAVQPAPYGSAPEHRDVSAKLVDQSPSALNARLTEIDERTARVTSLKAKFIQRKRSPLLKRPIESSGTVRVKGDRLRWDTLKPEQSILTVDSATIQIYYPAAKTLEIHAAAGDLRLISGTPLPRLSDLKAQFTFQEVNLATLGAAADAKDLLALELKPIKAELQSHLTSVHVLINTRLPCVQKLVIADQDQETTEIEFTDVQIGADVADDEVRFVAPEGTRVSRPQQQPAPAPNPASVPPATESAITPKQVEAK